MGRKGIITLIALVALAAGAGAASGRGPSVAFTQLAQSLSAGKTVNIVARAKHPAYCTLYVKPNGEAKQRVGIVYATGGLAHWSWHVPDFTSAGFATVTASCEGQGSITRTVRLVGGLIPPKIVVEKNGFSVRPRPYGDTASYGVVMRNISPNADALNVYVIVNFVMADGHLIGTVANTIGSIDANSEFNYGGGLQFPGAAPVDHLEIVVQVGGRQRGVSRAPSIDGSRLAPGRLDANWVGEAGGEVINDRSTFKMSNATLYCVILDANGNVVGGGSGFANATLPPGTRQAFALTTGVDSVPWARAASSHVSAVGTYVP